MKILNKKVVLSLSLVSLAGFANLACTQPASNGAANTTIVNTNANVVANSVNTATAIANSVINVPTGSAIDSKEPEKYQATVMLKVETSGAQNALTSFPPIKAEVARSGNDRRMEFKVPTGETVIFLDKGGRQLLVLPQRKQYAELNKESVGFEVRRFLMPEQIVNQMKNMKGVEQVGEEKIDGRDVIKYRYAGTTNTQSAAGQVNAESFLLVDKETGLPLRSFTNMAAQNNVQGVNVNAVNLVTEINNIRTDVDPNLFAEPTDLTKVQPEEIRSQINAIFSVAAAVIGNMMKSVNAEAPSPVPTASPAP